MTRKLSGIFLVVTLALATYGLLDILAGVLLFDLNPVLLAITLSSGIVFNIARVLQRL